MSNKREKETRELSSDKFVERHAGTDHAIVVFWGLNAPTDVVAVPKQKGTAKGSRQRFSEWQNVGTASLAFVTAGTLVACGAYTGDDNETAAVVDPCLDLRGDARPQDWSLCVCCKLSRLGTDNA